MLQGCWCSNLCLSTPLSSFIALHLTDWAGPTGQRSLPALCVLLLVCEDLNSGPCACTAGTLPTEPAPQPDILGLSSADLFPRILLFESIRRVMGMGGWGGVCIPHA